MIISSPPAEPRPQPCAQHRTPSTTCIPPPSKRGGHNVETNGCEVHGTHAARASVTRARSPHPFLLLLMKFSSFLQVFYTWIARSRSGSSSFTALALNKLSSSSSSSSSLARQVRTDAQSWRPPRISSSVYVCIHTYVRIYIHTYTHTYIHSPGVLQGFHPPDLRRTSVPTSSSSCTSSSSSCTPPPPPPPPAPPPTAATIRHPLHPRNWARRRHVRRGWLWHSAHRPARDGRRDRLPPWG